jgi:putative tricarboxylic transport membrane protein
MIGVAVVGGDVRMTWNISFLNSGIEIVSAMIGLFCIPVILDLTSMKGKHLGENETPKSLRLKESFLIMFAKKFEAGSGCFNWNICWNFTWSGWKYCKYCLLR